MRYPNWFFHLAGWSWQGWWGLGIPLLLIWSLFWKGWALWQAAKNEEKVWFTVFLVVNTAGILEIVYLFLFSSDFQFNRNRVKQFFSRP